MRVYTPDGVARVIVLDKPAFTIGRRNGADLQFSNSAVSREHAEIVRSGVEYVLRDRGSHSGTFVNQERISERTLVPGDRISLGPNIGIELVFNPEQTTASSISSQTPSDAFDLRQLAATLNGLRALGSARVLEDVLAVVIDAAIDVTGAERGFIMLANTAGQLEFTVARIRGHMTLPGRTFATSMKIPPEVFRTGQPRLVDDLARDARHGDTVKAGIQQIACVPLRVTPLSVGRSTAPERVIGVLYLDTHDPGKIRSRIVLPSLEAFATQAAMAIESARLYAESADKARLDHDLRVAAEIQRSLLAQPTFVGRNFELAAVSIPCRTIGGDFFDYLEMPDGGFAFALGDVAGKGPPAALLAAALQSHFAAHAALASDPGVTTAAINAALLRRPVEARFATMFHGMLTNDGRLLGCNAGQEPPFVLSKSAANGGVRWLRAGGPVLGLFEAGYESESIVLSSNDLIVVCSDGITEAANPAGEEFGSAGVIDAVIDCQGKEPEAVLDQLLDAVRDFTQGAPQADDMTAMIIRYTAA